MAKYVIATFVLHLVVLLQGPNYVESGDVTANVTFSDGTNTLFVGESDHVIINDGNTMAYARFLGIRYGESPAGDNRLKKVGVYHYANDTVEVKKHGHVCPQVREGNSLITKNDTMSEDCLFLNIFVPLNNGSTVQDMSQLKEKKAVYIFIHGGAYLRGSSNLYDSPVFTTQGDIIVVNINYRLGLLGFLTTDDSVIPANLGLWDQQLAIQWVYRHIEAFGGDMNRITVGGQSAGSFSSILQSFYSGNDKLFKNTIAESGSPLAMTIVLEKGRPAAMAFAAAAGCNLQADASSNEIRACFMAIPASKIVLLKSFTLNTAPTLDNDFISKETFSLFPQHLEHFKIPESIPAAFSNKNLLIGFNDQDGEIVYELSLPFLAFIDPSFNASDPISPDVVRLLIERVTRTKEDAVVDAVNEYYTDWTQPFNPVVRSREAMDLLTDAVFAVPTINTALIHSIGGPRTYLYKFSLPLTSPLAYIKQFPWFRGAQHGIELIFLSDRRTRLLVPGLSDLMISSWSNFIKTGNPNNGGSTDWKAYNETTREMFHMSVSPKSTAHALAKKAHFWNEYLPSLEDALRAEYKQGKESGAAGGGGRTITLDILLLGLSLVMPCYTLISFR